MERCDVLVAGAGFGGLGAALRLAERGARVVVCEALSYPGGCACTFERGGHRYEAGATLFSGFAAGQLFHDWVVRHELDVELDWIDPVVHFRTPATRVDVPRRRDDLVEAFATMPGAPAGVRPFFAEQKRVADVLWRVLGDPELLPPFGARAALRHALSLPRYLPVLRWMGKPLGAMLAWHGLDRFRPLRTYLDALCQITVQCSAAEAEAPFALGTIDYYWRGTAHVRGGIGRLAHALVDAIRRAGGDVRFLDDVRGLEPRAGGGWRVTTRRGELEARHVAANVLPGGLRRLLPKSIAVPRLAPLERRVEEGWGACMLYLRADVADDGPPRHLQLVQDESRPLFEGNHLFCSVGEGPGTRSVTVSTHVRPDSDVPVVHELMRAGVRALAPELEVVDGFTASPRTFERWTRRPGGFVGGVPRRFGWSHYLRLGTRPVLPGLHLVGDTVFPGQSTLAAALGGIKLANRLAP